MDLTPRSVEVEERRPSRPARSPWAVVVLVLVLAGVAIVAVKALGEASLYYYNVDEVADPDRRDELGDDRIRLQGTVQDGVDARGDVVLFEVAFGGEAVEVEHHGDPPDLFQPGTPVVLEGHFAGDVFESDRMLIKHSEEYKADNPDRVPADAP